MKRNYKLVLVVIAISLGLFAFTTALKPKGDPEKDKMIVSKPVQINQKNYTLYNGILVCKYIISIYNKKHNNYKPIIFLSIFLGIVKSLIVGLIRLYVKQSFFGDSVGPS